MANGLFYVNFIIAQTGKFVYPLLPGMNGAVYGHTKAGKGGETMQGNNQDLYKSSAKNCGHQNKKQQEGAQNKKQGGAAQNKANPERSY